MAFKKVNKSETEKRGISLKLLATGETACGKSYFGLTFPQIAIIDSEMGTQFYVNKDITIGGRSYNNVVMIDETCDLTELEENLEALIDGELDGIKTIVIDSETKFYNALTSSSEEILERKAKQQGKNYDQRKMWALVKKVHNKLQQLKITASAKGVNVISVCQGKWNKDDETKKETWKIEASSSIQFDYDVVLRFYKEFDKKTKETKYFAEVLKDRTGVTQVGDVIENCTYDVWKSVIEGNGTTKVSDINFSKDVKTSEKAMLAEVEKSETLANEIKAALKTLSQDQTRLVKGKIDELGIDVKQLAYEDVEKLVKLNSFIKEM